MAVVGKGQPSCTWSGHAWRYTPAHREPLDAGGSLVHGGRWNPAGKFAALYLGTPRASVLDDLVGAMRAFGLGPAERAGYVLHEVRVPALRLLDLRSPVACNPVGLHPEDLLAEDRSACQRVGQAAWEHGLQGVLAPAATGSGLVLAVFVARVSQPALAVERSEPLLPE